MKVKWKEYLTNGIHEELRKETQKTDLGYLSVNNKFLLNGEKGTHGEVINKEIIKEKLS